MKRTIALFAAFAAFVFVVPVASAALRLPNVVKKGHRNSARIASQSNCQFGNTDGYDGNNLWTLENYFSEAGSPECYAHQQQGLGLDLSLNGTIVPGSYHVTNCADDTPACVNSVNITLPPNTTYIQTAWDQETIDSGYSFATPLPSDCVWTHQPTVVTCTSSWYQQL